MTKRLNKMASYKSKTWEKGSISQLREEAKRRHVSGFSSMTKAELIEELSKYDV